ncbi:LexA family transcriptional regulator [Klebsiella pneumoniae]|nr:LexA family transcriptional regulator [Klebsiella pneumoniae]
MAVEIKYVVIREGEEKMSFASKKRPTLTTKCSIWQRC